MKTKKTKEKGKGTGMGKNGNAIEMKRKRRSEKLRNGKERDGRRVGTISERIRNRRNRE